MASAIPSAKKSLSLQSIALPPLAVATATAFFYFASPIIVPVICAVFSAYLLNPAVAVLRHVKLPHSLAVVVVMLAVLFLVALGGYLLVNQIRLLSLDLPKYWDGVLSIITWLQTRLAEFQKPEGLTANAGGNLVAQLKWENISGASKFIFKGLGSVMTFLVGALLIFFLTFFLLFDQRNLQSRVLKAFGGGREEVAAKIIGELNRQISGFISLKFIVTLVLAIVFTVGLLLFKIKYAYFWGPLAAMLNLIPYVGAIVGTVAPMIVAGVQYQSLWMPLWVLIFFVAIQTIESNIVTPKILGEKVNLNPLAVLIASIYWGWLWGAIGAILAVPITAAAKVVCDHVDSLQPIGILLGGKK